MTDLSKLLGVMWEVYLEVQLHAFRLTYEEREEIANFLALVCAEHCNKHINNI